MLHFFFFFKAYNEYQKVLSYVLFKRNCIFTLIEWREMWIGKILFEKQSAQQKEKKSRQKEKLKNQNNSQINIVAYPLC